MSLDKSAPKIKSMFGAIARRYDFLNHLLSLNIDKRWRKRTVQKVPPGDGPVLDVCTGTGDLALAYCRAGKKKIKVVGIDFCPEMLAIAQKKAQRAGAEAWLSLVEGDALHLPFDDGTFEIVCIGFGLRNVSDPAGALKEMLRVCRPGGRMAVLEFSQPRGRLTGPAYRFYFRRVLPRIGRLFSRDRFDAYNYLPRSVQEFPDGPGLAAMMRDAGMADVEFFPLFPLGAATLYVGRRPPGNTTQWSAEREKALAGT
ncbi:MAG: bifunctional demethylmenaquinone methyltransferase/2-methoxy-6-polyprenyl-1,4-benzoquinol methylase UbiE [Planctomycetia bacterium]|nr:bifunctional demethylmenaquinone methyltransferase/2-methoxy-6-polyprenyl-1,4-benzoquinol methylase UbiE [Planctomycetia bacterium]